MDHRTPVAALAAVMAVCTSPAARGEPAPLTDATLDGVTAGTPAPESERPTAVVADGAHYEAQSHNRVELRERALEDARVLNAVSASGSDAVNTVNVLTGRGEPSISAFQQNVLRQEDVQLGALGRASVVAPSLVETRYEGWSQSTGGRRSSVDSNRLKTHSRVSTVEQYSAEIPAYYPLQNLSLTVGTPKLDPLHIGAFEIDFIADTDVGKYGIGGKVGPFTLAAPELVLGTISLDGDDVVLSSGYVELPDLDLGSAELKVCFVTCAAGSVDLGGFDGPRIDFPGDDLRFEGANPFKDVRINAGHGVAAVGSGYIEARPGRVRLDASLELDLPDLQFSFDFQIPGISFGELGSIGPWDVDGPDIDIEIPAVGFSHTLIDEQVGVAYSASFDGVLCLAIHTTNCARSSRSEERREERIEEEIRSAVAASHASETSFSSGGRETVTGATLTGAEAELILMSEARARIDSLSDIALADGAQRGLRAVNAVNAAGTLIGNSLNVISLQAPPAIASGAIGQSNVFLQYRTRYGQ